MRTKPIDPSRFTCRVTAEDIRSGMAKNSNHCMIADAIRRIVPDAKRVSADMQSIRFTAWGFRYIYLTPVAARVGLRRFDAGDTYLKPFSFRLESPRVRAESVRARSVEKTATIPARNKKKSTRKPPSRVLTMDREFGMRKFVESGR